MAVSAAASSACEHNTPSRLSLRENGKRITAPGCQSAADAPGAHPARLLDAAARVLG